MSQFLNNCASQLHYSVIVSLDRARLPAAFQIDPKPKLADARSDVSRASLEILPPQPECIFQTHPAKSSEALESV